MNIFSLSQEHFDSGFDSDSFLFADKVATEQYGYNGSFRKNEQIFYAIEEAMETSSALESILNILSSNKIENKHEVKAINFALEHLTRQIGFKPKSYSLESYSGQIALEGIGSLIKAIWDAIISAIKKVGETIGSFFKWLIGSGEATEKHSELLVKELKKTKTEYSDLTPESKAEIKKYNEKKEDLQRQLNEAQASLDQEQSEAKRMASERKENIKKESDEKSKRREEFINKEIEKLEVDYNKNIDGIKTRLGRLKNEIKEGPPKKLTFLDARSGDFLDDHKRWMDSFLEKHFTAANFSSFTSGLKKLSRSIHDEDLSEYFFEEFPHLALTMKDTFGIPSDFRKIKPEEYSERRGTSFTSSRFYCVTMKNLDVFYGYKKNTDCSFLDSNIELISRLLISSDISNSSVPDTLVEHTPSLSDLDLLIKISEKAGEVAKFGDYSKNYEALIDYLNNAQNTCKEYKKELDASGGTEEDRKALIAYQKLLSVIVKLYPNFIYSIMERTKKICDEFMSQVGFCTNRIKAFIEIEKNAAERKAFREKFDLDCAAIRKKAYTI